MIQRADFPVTLIFPPQGHFTQPYLALPCLKAWLLEHGFGDVELVDASIEAYDHFLSAEFLQRAAERVRDRLPLAEFEAKQELAFEELEGFRAAAEAALAADVLAREVEGAKAVLRGEDCFDMALYPDAVRTLYHGLRLTSAAYFPSRLTPHNFTMAYANDRSADVLAATVDEDQNPFIDFYREVVLPRLVARKPRVLGLSVIYGSQLIPALTLGRLVKQALPDCHVTAGGGFLAYIGKKLMRAAEIDTCLDSMIFHEGENPLLALCETLRDGGPQAELSGVGSLTWFDRGRTGNARARVVENPPAHPVRLEDAPLPDFDGLPLDKYFSPELVLPYDINRGCYYGECAFCSLPTVIGPGYRTRSAERIAEHTLALKQRYGTRNFNYITDCMPPGMIQGLPECLLAVGADVRWWCDARVEPKAYTPEGARRLYESGCRKLLFGFETATPRLLKLMKKGQSPRATLEVARNCSDAGISVTFYAMVGFPGETAAEARDTLHFLLEHKDVVREVSLQTFHVDEVAQTYRDAEAFGLEVLDDPEADLQLYYDYLSGEGMSQEQAAELFEEMMAGFREHYPLFGGENIYYFMQKSHYFLHLARDVKPDEFGERCRARTERSWYQPAADTVAPHADLAKLELPFSYAETVRRLAHPLARAVRPDFLTGRYVEGAAERAETALGALPRKRSVLARAGAGAEFAELTPDGAQLVDALAAAGSLEALLEEVPRHARDRVEAFARKLYRMGLLTDVAPPAAARV